MPPSYLETAIFEAMKKAKGNQTKARALLIAQCKDDDTLLRALAIPHLNAIAAHAVNRIAIQQKASKGKNAALDSPVPPVPKAGKAEAGFGLDLLKALGGQNVPKFGREDAAPRLQKKAASDAHVKALKMMASKSKTKSK